MGPNGEKMIYKCLNYMNGERSTKLTKTHTTVTIPPASKKESLSWSWEDNPPSSNHTPKGPAGK